MTLQQYIEDYKALADFFQPDYKRKNKVLQAFRGRHLILTDELAMQLKEILEIEEIGPEQYFVADLLYMYPSFTKLLFEPMINCAIRYRDPSFCRIFLRPCITSFGVKAVATLLTEKFTASDVAGKIGVAMLIYWLRYKDHKDVELLHNTIIAQANTSNNLVERYIYALYFRDEMNDTAHIPNSGVGIMALVKEDKTYEDLLKQLKWR